VSAPARSSKPRQKRRHRGWGAGCRGGHDRWSQRGGPERGLSAEDAATAAATGALKGAGEISSTAVDQVRKVVTETISGVKVVVKEPVK